MSPQRHLRYFEPGILFTILGLLHANLLLSFAHGTITKTVTVQTLPYVPQASPPPQSISFTDPTDPDVTFIFECPTKCNGGAACEWVNPTNCSEYINCDFRREPLLLACDEGLHFWSQMRQCAPPVQAKCKLNKDKEKGVGNQDLWRVVWVMGGHRRMAAGLRERITHGLFRNFDMARVDAKET
jgi:hypothetical protein